MANTPNPTLYRTAPVAGTSRQIQAWALTEAALRIKAARDGGDTASLLAAIRLNWRLWTLFQAELLGPDCTVPEPVRSNLVSLAAFIDRQTVELLASPKPEAAEILISINRDLAMGLLTETTDANAEAAQQPAPQPGADSFNISA